MRFDSRLASTFAACALLFAACRHKPVDVHLAPVSVEMTRTVHEQSRVIHAADGHTFAIVEVVRSARSPEQYDWAHARVIDTNGKAYAAKQAGVSRGESQSMGPFGIGTVTKAHPIRARLLFEVPANAVLRSVDIPQTVSLGDVDSTKTYPVPSSASSESEGYSLRRCCGSGGK